MSCIDIQVRRIGDVLDVVPTRIGLPVSFAAKQKGQPFDVVPTRMGFPVSFEAKRKGQPLAFRCGIVCSINSEFFLKVEEGTIWLIPDNDFSQDVRVISNVNWTID